MPENEYRRIDEWNDLAKMHDGIKNALRDAQAMIEALRIELKDAWAEVAKLKKILEEER